MNRLVRAGVAGWFAAMAVGLTSPVAAQVGNRLCADVVACNGEGPGTPNLLSNPGFENGLAYWQDMFGLPTLITETEAHGGQYSATKSVVFVAGQEYWSQVFQEVPLLPGEPVYASGFIKTTFSPLATAKAGLIAHFLDSSGALIVIGDDPVAVKSQDVGGQTDWRRVELTAAAAPAGTAKVRLSAFLFAAVNDAVSQTGQAFYDDLVLRKLFQLPVPQTELLNPGFENGLHDWHELFGLPAFVSTQEVHSGVYAAGKTVGTVSTQDYFSQLDQTLAFPAGTVADVTLWVKTDFDPLASATAGLKVEFLRADGTPIQSAQQVAAGQTDWTPLSVNEISPPETVKVRIIAFIFAPTGNKASVGGQAFYDDAQIAP